MQGAEEEGSIKWLLNYKARVADKAAHKAGLSDFFKL